jgi:glycine cleavage system aminomethyltransferase T
MAMLDASTYVDGPLDATLRQAGAVFGVQHGRLVALHYGSAAGELAACVHGVGITDRSDLIKLAVEGPPAQLDDLMLGLVGCRVAVGQAILRSGTWWCGAASDRVFVLCEPALGAPVRASLRSQLQRHAGLTAREQSHDWAAIGVIGKESMNVVRGVGANADIATQLPAFATRQVDGVIVDWLLADDRTAVALVGGSGASAVWKAIERAGRAFGIAHVGREAATRYALGERAKQRPRTASGA